MVWYTTWRLKQCPRCKGDLYREAAGWCCLQCGRVVIEQDRPLVAHSSVSRGGSLDNRRPRGRGRRVNPWGAGDEIGVQIF